MSGWGSTSVAGGGSWGNTASPGGWGGSPSGGRPQGQGSAPVSRAASAPSTAPASSSWGGGPSSSWGGSASQPAADPISSWGNTSSTTGWGGSGNTGSSWGASGGWGGSSASSWASTAAKNPDEYGRNGNQQTGSFASDVCAAGAQAYESYVDSMREKQDVTVTTARMLDLCAQTDQVANHSIQGLKEQNEKLEHLQDEMAEIHDDLNTSEKKMKQIKSFWGGWSTIGSSKTHDQHQKQRVKDERNRDKTQTLQEKEMSKQRAQDDRYAAKNQAGLIKDHVSDNKKVIHNAKKENMAEAKAINKGHMEAAEEKQVWGGHVFESRIDGSGPKHQAEEDLDQITNYIHGFHEKANLISSLVDEGGNRAHNVNHEVERAVDRTRVLNKQADRYCGKK